MELFTVNFVPIAVGLLIAGLVTGVLAGLFGVGGGLVAVPVLYELFRVLDTPDSVRMHLCVGTSLAIIAPTAWRSYSGHLKRGAVDRPVLRQWTAPVLVGVACGAGLAAIAPEEALKIVLIAGCVAVAVKLAFERESWRLGSDLPGRWAMRAIGFVTGLLSTLMGIGGGLFGNLVLTLYGRPIHTAVATSSGLGVLIAGPAALGYVIAGWDKMAALPPGSLGFVSLIGVAFVAPTSVLATPIGVALAHRFAKRTLELAFAGYLAIVATRFLFTL